MEERAGGSASLGCGLVHPCALLMPAFVVRKGCSLPHHAAGGEGSEGGSRASMIRVCGERSERCFFPFLFICFIFKRFF